MYNYDLIRFFNPIQKTTTAACTLCVGLAVSTEPVVVDLHVLYAVARTDLMMISVSCENEFTLCRFPPMRGRYLNSL